MADFYPPYRATRGHEKGHVNHARDRGGETYHGVARNRWPNWEGWALIDQSIERSGRLTPLVAEQIEPMLERFYRVNFWDPIKGDDIPTQALAGLLFDIAVNQGTPWAGMYLQRALNALNRGGRDYPDLVPDSVIGPQTLGAVRAFLERRRGTVLRFGEEPRRVGGESILLAAVAFQKWQRWADITRDDESQEDFTNGWAVRGIQEVLDYLHNRGVL